MKGKHLADYETVKIAIELTPDEKKRYYENQTIYEQFIRQKKIKFSRPDLKTILRAGAFDPQAHRAFIARMESRRIIVGASGKLDVLDSLLKIHRGDQILIFTISNDLVYQISEQFLIPAITHHTKVLERKWLLDGFRNGAYSVLVTSRVLNEGVDLPSANVAIILSGTASPVEHLQRLGRILRKGEHKKAMLYELVSRGTRETSMSYRRRRSDAYQ